MRDNYGKKKLPSGKASGVAVKVITYVLLAVWALAVLLPFYWMIMSSFKSSKEYNSELTPSFFARSFTAENYATAFNNEYAPLGRYLLNTAFFAAVTTGVMLIVIIFAAFAFARLRFRGKNVVFIIFLSLMMIPSELVVITNYVTITDLNLRNTYLGLILPSVTSVFYIYLLKESFEMVPDEVYKASKVDGTSDLKFLFRIMVPMSKPTIITIVILKVIECWNSYVWPRLIINDRKHSLVSNGIEEIRTSSYGKDNIPAMMAAVVIISIPLIVLFLIFRKKIMEGVSRGGTKG